MRLTPSYGFSFGPSDGQFGAIPAGGKSYTFYGSAGSTSSCAGTLNVRGVFTFTGTLDHVTGGNGCTRLFGPGDGPAGWVFDSDYAGGGQVMRFDDNGKSGWLMPFHGEVWWKNPSTSNHKCNNVSCFYSSLGLAVSNDNGKTFKVVGQILQPSEPIPAFEGGGKNMMVGYGSLIVADANGKHLDNPPADPSGAYFYLFYTDLLLGSPCACASNICMGVARAAYAELISAALSGDHHKVANLFHKYDGASPNPWTQPATSDTPDLSGTAGKFLSLWHPGISMPLSFPSLWFISSSFIRPCLQAYWSFILLNTSQLAAWNLLPLLQSDSADTAVTRCLPVSLENWVLVL